ncbi:TonB-dependent receptor plug domain-containing protein [Reichenbachiella faecimaris]|nr:TonB-dependent receptor plug domain-containing protein [Reichenbachiella faecimaris]
MKQLTNIFFYSVLGLSTLVSSNLFGQVADEDIFEMSLEELMNMEVTVASTQALTSRESPGIISLITSSDIQKSGARDLIDVLRTIPGFEFGVDVQGVVGIGLRGNWGHEGKILILVDGQEMNERSYATSQIGNHFPLEQIDRIEIIRGPGSATYGGYAELGVINIHTKKGKDLNGGSLALKYGQMQNTFGRREADVMFGQAKEDLSYDIKFHIGDGNRSDRIYTDLYGDAYDMKDNSGLRTTMINAGIKKNNLSTRFIFEDYNLEQRDLYDAILPVTTDIKFQGIYGEVKYDAKISEKLTVTPKIQYKSQKPWVQNDQTARDLDIYYDKTINQILGEVVLNSQISEKTNLIGGMQYYNDKAESQTGYEFASNNSTSLSFYNFSAFAQGLFKTNFALITVGARYNKHEQFGSAFVPRIGITKVIDKFHGKLLLSQAFRAPSIENIDANLDIKAETTTVFELEAGYQMTQNMLLTANFYNILINDPIVYFYDVATDEEGYTNYDKTGTRGIEVDYQYRGDWGSVGFNYSFYTAAGNNKVASYSVDGNDDELLGFGQNKANLLASIKVTDQFSINPTITYLGERHGYATADASDDPVLQNFDAETFLNLYMLYKDLFIPGLQIGAGVYNLTNNDYAFIQPYNSSHAPLPAASREFIIKAKYSFTK